MPQQQYRHPESARAGRRSLELSHIIPYIIGRVADGARANGAVWLSTEKSERGRCKPTVLSPVGDDRCLRAIHARTDLAVLGRLWRCVDFPAKVAEASVSSDARACALKRVRGGATACCCSHVMARWSRSPLPFTFSQSVRGSITPYRVHGEGWHGQLCLQRLI